ncbi:putative membrane protein [Halomonas citrativorans]|uniref:Membrane protein n=1 Tax=Halomonas citrativorans TaxID=2742612 RepID=A0A1R4I2L4_9GAMM|nr:alkaline phosphatase [Halomonas citrativorans]SJN14025.1 putative membrane protein [Halomonas citrativorans]
MLRLFIGAFALNILLVAPLWWHVGTLGQPLIAWEAWVIVPLMLLLPVGYGRRVLGVAIAGWVVLVTAANLGNATTYTAFGRPLNVYLDLPLLRSIFHLLVGNVGQIWAFCAMLAGAAGLMGILWGLLYVLLPALSWGLDRFKGKVALGVLLLAAGLAIADNVGKPLSRLSTLPAVESTRFQWQQIRVTHQAQLDFAEQLDSVSLDAQPLPGLEEVNVLVAFVESYGVSALNDVRYSDILLPTLAAMEHRLAAQNLHVVSGLLQAPIRGGQSWLAHATLLSGRWIDNQLWYWLMLNSENATLIDDFKATGQQTLSIMPAITLAWPEGEAYGFDTIVAAKDIDYAGPALHWVTMPDQFTLDYTERHLLGNTPVFAQMALISSHAPWTPILPVIDDWETIGDGAIFAPWEHAGDPPEVVWQDVERIRDHYAWSVDYAVEVVGRWAERVVDDKTLLIVLGDHQPAPLITGDDVSAAVPVHIISGDPALLAPFCTYGFVEGTLPSLDNPEKAARMSQLRHWLREAFGSR